jgi:hypothetical protein
MRDITAHARNALADGSIARHTSRDDVHRRVAHSEIERPTRALSIEGTHIIR